jgi:cysteine desulfurase
MEKEVLDFTSPSPCRAAIERMSSGLAAPRLSPQDLKAPLEAIYDLVGASVEDTFVFLSSEAEAIHHLFWSLYFEVARKEGKSHIIASALEDAPTMLMLKKLEELGCTVKIAPTRRDGRLDLERLKELINPRTAFITLSVAQGQTGAIQPFEEAIQLAKEKNVLIHLNASHAVGKLYFAFKDLGADYLTFSGDWIHSVPGTAALFAKKGKPCHPAPVGGFPQAQLLALSAAAIQASLMLDSTCIETARLRDLFESEIVRLCPRAQPLFKEELRLPNVSAILFPKIHAEALLYLIQRQGVYPQIGGSFSQHLHRLLFASGIQEGESALSFSLNRTQGEKEILRAAKIVAESANSLMKLSEDL